MIPRSSPLGTVQALCLKHAHTTPPRSRKYLGLRRVWASLQFQCCALEIGSASSHFTTSDFRCDWSSPVSRLCPGDYCSAYHAITMWLQRHRHSLVTSGHSDAVLQVCSCPSRTLTCFSDPLDPKWSIFKDTSRYSPFHCSEYLYL